MNHDHNFDAYAPREIPARVQEFCVVKARLPLLSLALLGMLAGAFVAAGFEHSIANMYLMPLAMLLGAPIGPLDMLLSLLPVIAGNLVGGSVLVALVYHLIYVRPVRLAASRPDHSGG